MNYQTKRKKIEQNEKNIQSESDNMLLDLLHLAHFSLVILS